MASKRAIPKTALSKKQIHGMSSRELLSHVSPEMRKQAQTMSRMNFGGEPLKRLESESDGQFLRRSREAREVDHQEYKRLYRQNLENALYQSQATARAIDLLSADLTPEKIAENERVTAEREAKDRAQDLDGYSTVPYGLQDHGEKKEKK